MTSTLSIDIETRSSVNLKDANVYRYVIDPNFEILMASYAVDDGPVLDVIGQDDVLDIPGLFDPKVKKVAHNAGFERVCFSAASGLPEGTYIHPREWDCTLALASTFGYPRSLKNLGKFIGGEEKDEAGTALVKFFCVPNKDGTFNSGDDHPEKWEAFVRYCNQDTATHREAYFHFMDLGGWPTNAERNTWIVDQLINDRGIHINIPMAIKAKRAAELNAIDQKKRITELSGIDNPNSVPQMKRWVAEELIDNCPNMQAKTLEALLLSGDLEPHQREVLELRGELAMASSKKYGAALASVCSDSRLRGTLSYHGAHTGRWSGRGTQIQNLPSAAFKDDWDELFDEPIKGSGLLKQEACIQNLLDGERVSPLDLKRLVRPMFDGAGKGLTVVDYSSIEAVVIGWLAGESWLLRAFEDHRDLYVETAKRLGPQFGRKEGKIATLALGFAGGIGSLQAFGAEGSAAELQVLVKAWRAANPNIVNLWRLLDSAFDPSSGSTRVGKHLMVTHSKNRHGVSTNLHLPSGRVLRYHDVRYERYRVVDEATGRAKMKESWRFINPGIPFSKTARKGTYGGRLTENVVQATARDLLASGLVGLEKAGYKVVGHVHDEVLIEGIHPIDEIEAIFCKSPSWAVGLPFRGDGGHTDRYRKI